jgi:hypothetical protein
VARLPELATVLAAPAAPEPIADIATAVGDALRYPISGPSLEELAAGARRVTVVVERPTLPVPGVQQDPRQEALAAVLDELTSAGIEERSVSVLVAGGLERKAGRRDLEQLLRPARARDYRGAVEVHDVEDAALVPLAVEDGSAVRISPHVADADLVVVVTAAETLADGGPAALVRACDAQTVRRLAEGQSLLEHRGSPAWECATWVERAVRARTAVIGVALTLDHPRPRGRFRDWPSTDAARRVASSPLRSMHGALPGWLRVGLLQALERELTVLNVLAGPPSSSHTEALLRGVPLKGAPLAEPVDTILVPAPWKSLHQPREAPNPITTASVTLGHALRLWRVRSPLTERGTVIVHAPFGGTIGTGAESPFLRAFHAIRHGARGRRLRAVERLARTDPRALDRYRSGAAAHPQQPFADWASCQPVLERAGRVIVAGCRDAAAAKALGFVPTHNLQTALAMARGVAGSEQSLGVILAPPYPPLSVGEPVVSE